MPLSITVPACSELWDPVKEEFLSAKEVRLTLEHSLLSLSKWEAKYHKPFLSKDQKTSEETLDYIRFMTITQGVSPEVYYRLSSDNVRQIEEYIEDPMTATTVKEQKGRTREIVTSELIYYWMIALGIPFECQKWHLNRLLMLIKVCSAKNAPQKKMGKGALMRRNSELNAARRARLHSRG